MKTLSTVIEMLTDRNYVTIQACQTVEEVMHNMSTGAAVARACVPDTLMPVRVQFHNEDRIGVKPIRGWFESDTPVHVIAVSLEGPTAFAKRECELSNQHVEFFTFRDLSVNITKHALVPKHERLSAESVAQLPYDSKKHKTLPVLYTTDRVAQYYNYQPGDVIRITRTAGTQEPTHFFRLVQHPPG